MEPLSFNIVPAGWRDLWPVDRVEHICFRDDTWPLIDILGVLILPGIVRLKVVVDGEIVGFAAGEERDHAGWITTIGVLPDFRRRGIARALLAACEAQLKPQRLMLCVRSSNLAAQQLYLQTGYRQVKVWAHYYRGGEDALVMEKGR
jgi:ribosomal-protein-alanine N-acetyltransferase